VAVVEAMLEVPPVALVEDSVEESEPPAPLVLDEVEPEDALLLAVRSPPSGGASSTMHAAASIAVAAATMIVPLFAPIDITYAAPLTRLHKCTCWSHPVESR
jgi:hypothetical protein